MTTSYVSPPFPFPPAVSFILHSLTPPHPRHHATPLLLQETFGKRLKTFYAQTEPMLDHYRRKSGSITEIDCRTETNADLAASGKKDLFVNLKGETSKQIWPHLVKIVHERFPNLKQQQRRSESQIPRQKTKGSQIQIHSICRKAEGDKKLWYNAIHVCYSDGAGPSGSWFLPYGC